MGSFDPLVPDDRPARNFRASDSRVVPDDLPVRYRADVTRPVTSVTGHTPRDRDAGDLLSVWMFVFALAVVVVLASIVKAVGSLG